MSNGVVAFAGRTADDQTTLESLVKEFEWSFRKVDKLQDVARLAVDHNLVTVLVSPKHLDMHWRQALQEARHAVPTTLPILCETFGDPIDWAQAIEMGAFHSVYIPFDAREVRQSLGFVWAEKRRLMGALSRQRCHLHLSTSRVPIRKVRAQMAGSWT